MSEEYANIPILASADESNTQSEVKALELGAWDFVTRPYDRTILLFRLRGVIERSQISTFRRLRYLVEFDGLTGLYNQNKFFERTQEMLRRCQQKNFVMIRFDIDRFKLINMFYGTQEGDRLLRYLAKSLLSLNEGRDCCTFGRMDADVFACCMSYSDRESVMKGIERGKRIIKAYNRSFDIVPIFGVYFVDDPALPPNVMLDRATLAAKTCKGNYINTVAVYEPKMSSSLEQEQEIINDMLAMF